MSMTGGAMQNEIDLSHPARAGNSNDLAERASRRRTGVRTGKIKLSLLEHIEEKTYWFQN